MKNFEIDNISFFEFILNIIQVFVQTLKSLEICFRYQALENAPSELPLKQQGSQILKGVELRIEMSRARSP